MMKLFFSIILWGMTSFVLFAQNTAYYQRMKQTFENIDPTKVTTGHLKEFGIRFNEVEAYDGTLQADNYMNHSQWQALYSSLYTMRVGMASATMTAPGTLNDNWKGQQAANPDEVLLTALYYHYQEYKPNALNNGDITVSNGAIYDVAGRNPYQTKTAFAVALSKIVLKGSSFTFRLPADFYHTNTGQTPLAIAADFGNGQGYQSITMGQVKTISYTSSGEKDIIFRFSFSGGITLYSRSKIDVVYQNTTTAYRYNGAGLLFNRRPIDSVIAQGDTVRGFVTIELAPVAGRTQLTKPLIVVEGFDPKGRNGYFNLINGADNGGLLVDIDTGPGINFLNQAIEDEDYDLVFVDYANGTDYIQRNASMLEEVIDWVNSIKVGSEPNVIVGYSMGGLVTRYALRNMELTGRDHETRLYITHDTPHQGANVPLAAQALVRHLGGESFYLPVFLSLFQIDVMDVSDVVPQLGDALALVESPAAKQMMIYQLRGTGGGVGIESNSLHTAFMAELRNMGHPGDPINGVSPNTIRRVAISNGAECSTPLDFAPYAPIARINERVDLPDFVSVLTGFLNLFSLNPIKALTSFLSTDTDIVAGFNLNALPNQQYRQIYSGSIVIEKEILWILGTSQDPLINGAVVFSSPAMLPIDNASGGFYDIQNFLGDLPSGFDSYILEKQFCFIPTYSSIDQGTGNAIPTVARITSNFSPFEPPSNQQVPFDNFFTNPIISENHVQFTANNGNWLIDELENGGGFYSCATTCFDDINLTINGPTTVCSGGNSTFFLNGLSDAARNSLNITWQVTPANLVTVSSGTGTIASFSPASPRGRGGITLTYTISSPNNLCNPITISAGSWIGTPNPIQRVDPLVPNFTVPAGYVTYLSAVPSTFGMVPSEQITGYDWSLPTGTIHSGAGTGAINASFTYNNGNQALIRVRAQNACGWGPWRDFYIGVSSGNGGGGILLLVAPNPASVETELIIDEEDGNTSEDTETEWTYEVYDHQGKLKWKKKAKKKKVKLKLDKFDKGIHHARAISEKGNLSTSFIVE